MTQALTSPEITTTDVGCTLPTDLPFSKWCRLGQTLCASANSLAWYIADWARYGQTRYDASAELRADEDMLAAPEKDHGHLAQFAQANGLDYDALRKCARVAARVPCEKRRANLTYAHHYTVADLPWNGQDKWLATASSERLSVADLRQRIRESSGTEREDKSKPVKLPNSLPPDKLLAWFKSQPEGFFTDDVQTYWRERLRPLVEYWHARLGSPDNTP